jgi:HAD superfamily hydrolase (TIGR01459 family)
LATSLSSPCAASINPFAWHRVTVIPGRCALIARRTGVAASWSTRIVATMERTADHPPPDTTKPAAGTRMLPGISALPDCRGLVLDQWGVLHDGHRPLPGALDCLARLRAAGTRIVIVSNSGRSGAANAELMAGLGIAASDYDAVVTAGDAACEALVARSDAFHRALGRRALVIARDEDRDMIAALGIEAVDAIDAAELLLVMSWNPGHRSASDYEAMLREALARRLPMVCGNPDVTTPSAGRLVDAVGAIARRYEAMGGAVSYHGKPYPAIYAMGLDLLARHGVAARDVVAVGDSIAHDIVGARGAGLRSALVAGGIHRDALGIAPGELPSAARWAAFARDAEALPDYLVATFRW